MYDKIHYNKKIIIIKKINKKDLKNKKTKTKRKKERKRHIYPNVHRSTVYNSQDMEAT